MIYFCIPALNEERTVGVVLWKLRQVMTELQRDFQIIVVDDASTDATQEVLSPYLRVLPLTLVRNEKQLGYAASMEIAIREAVRRSPYPKRDAIVTLQADFTEDPDHVPALVKRIEAGADLVATQPLFDEGTPPNVRRVHKFFRWLVRGREWAELGDPFSGFRAYRVMTVKRAIEARGTARLLSWEGVAANAELLAQSIPHSRRNDMVDATIHYKRLQRPSRFRFFAALSQVMGVRSGKHGPAVPVSLPDSTIVVPAALAVELAHGHKREEARRRPTGPRRTRDSRETRERAPRENAKDPRRTRTRATRPPRQERAVNPEQQLSVAPVQLIPEATDAPATDAAAAPARERKRRRPRRRSRKPSQKAGEPGTTAEAPENGEAAVIEIAAENGSSESGLTAPRKKSRRGRRGGRGRRRGPRQNADGSVAETASDSAPESVNNSNGEGSAEATQ